MNIVNENIEYALLLLKEKKIIDDDKIGKAKDLIAESDDNLSIFDALIRCKFATEEQIFKGSFGRVWDGILKS